MKKCSKCTNKFVIALANRLESGTFISVNLEANKFGFCKECHKFRLIGRKDKTCSVCYYQALEEATMMNWS